MNPARHTSSTPNSSSTVLMVLSNSARLPYSLWSTTCEGQTNTLINGKNKIIDRTGLLHTYPCLDASQRRPLQALNSRSVGDDQHNLCRAGRTLGLVYQGLQVGACDHHKKDFQLKPAMPKMFNWKNRTHTCSRYQHTNFGPLVRWTALLVDGHPIITCSFCLQEAVL